MLKTFNHGNTPSLYAGRNAKPNEAAAAYLFSKKEAGYAQKAGVTETQYFTVAVGGKFQMVDSLGLRALLKRHPEAASNSMKSSWRRSMVKMGRDHKWESVMYDPATNEAKLIDTSVFHKVSKTQRETRFIRGGRWDARLHARSVPHWSDALHRSRCVHPGNHDPGT